MLKTNNLNNILHEAVKEVFTNGTVNPLPTTPDLDKLLDCPFCGCIAVYFNSNSRTTGHGISEDVVGVKCTGCHDGLSFDDYAGHEVYDRQVKAASTWNSRGK